MRLREKLKNSPKLKNFILWTLMPKNQARPRWWVKIFVNPFVHSKGKRSLIRRRMRLDVMPFNRFSLGDDSTIEDFSTVNNGVGDVLIGDRTRIGLGCVLIGPVTIGNDVLLAQNIVVSGLNHGYRDINQPINTQPVEKKAINIEDEAWIGANSIILPGVTIGRHSIVAGGSVVTRSVPPYTIVAGNPAVAKKHYDASLKEWVRN
ncbi:MAG: acyltransferase [Bacteroidales bacterium]|nr:acyltransferase [Bacteroidales bacterium]